MLTPEREAEIRLKIKVTDETLSLPSVVGRPVATPIFWCEDARVLLAEIDRLRAENANVQGMANIAHAEVARLQAENEALREEAERLAEALREIESKGTTIIEVLHPRDRECSGSRPPCNVSGACPDHPYPPKTRRHELNAEALIARTALAAREEER